MTVGRVINLAKFHINKDGVPAPCKAQPGNCPLGNDNQHFETEKEAQVHADNSSANKYGVLPEMKNNDELSDEWKQKFLSNKNFDTFVRENAREIVSDNIFEGSGDLQKASLEKWKELHYENSLSSLREISNEESINTVRENVDSSELNGWFREYNSDYKPKIEQSLITNPEVRNASLNIAHSVYKDKTGEDISYNDFLEKDVVVYRGGNSNMIDNDVFISYSFDKRIAERFASEQKGSEVHSLNIKIKDTLGSLQTTGEAEVMVRRENTSFKK